jgi:hypothetical protein
VITVLTVLFTFVLAVVKGVSHSSGVRTGVTVVLVSLSGITMFPAVVMAVVLLLAQLLKIGIR